MTAREADKRAFLARAGWGAAERAHLAGDASARSYERIRLGGKVAVLMDAPPEAGEGTAEFLRIGAHLAGLGLSSPQVYEADEGLGFLLLEDLGDALYTNVLQNDPALERPLYDAAIDVLLAVQAAPMPGDVPDLSARDWAEAAGFAPDWYVAAITGQRPDAAGFTAVLTQTLADHADAARVLILRDYHAGNLLWLPDRKGVTRVGVLDFQQAQGGQTGYDLVSLLQDARRDVDPATEAAGLARFAAGKGLVVADLSAAYAALGAQRALRILGIFARLCLVAGKPAYIAMIPRVWGQLQRNLAHPALGALRAECLALLPEPTAKNLCQIEVLCGKNPFP